MQWYAHDFGATMDQRLRWILPYLHVRDSEGNLNAAVISEDARGPVDF